LNAFFLETIIGVCPAFDFPFVNQGCFGACNLRNWQGFTWAVLSRGRLSNAFTKDGTA
jgi:hypothetical protein